MELELQKEEVGQVGKRILNLLVTVPLTSRAVGYWSLAPELFTLLVDFVLPKTFPEELQEMHGIHTLWIQESRGLFQTNSL